MLEEEKTMKSEKIYDGRILGLRVDTVELPNMRYSKREIVEYPGAVAIVAITDEKEVLLVKQYRKPIEKFLLEIPAGKLEINEEPRETAKRELKEETGYEAGKLEYLFEFYPSPGITTEKMHIFLATDLIKGERNLEKGEYIENSSMKFEDIFLKIKRGEIADGKTIIGLHMARNFLEEKGIIIC